MNYFYWLDQFALVCVFLVGLWYTFHIPVHYQVLAIFSIAIVLFLSYGGHVLNKYCYDPDKDTGNLYQSFIHIIGALGHHSIMLGL